MESANNEDFQKLYAYGFLKTPGITLEYEQETPLKNSKLNSNMSCTCIHKLIEEMYNEKTKPLLHLLNIRMETNH